MRWFSIGSDARFEGELVHLSIGFAIAALAGIPRDSILNSLLADDVRAWARSVSASSSSGSAAVDA